VLEHVQGLQHHPALVRENLLHNPSINKVSSSINQSKLTIILSCGYNSVAEFIDPLR
jgi:tmRNA-binding protein